MSLPVLGAGPSEGATGISYLLNAPFTGANQGYSDAQVLDTAAEGVTTGSLTVVETDGDAEIVSNRVKFSAKTVADYGDLGVYESNGISRAIGRAMLLAAEVSATAARNSFGWNDSAQVNNYSSWDHGVELKNTIDRKGEGVIVVIGSYSINTEYEYALVLGGYDSSGEPWHSGAVGTFTYGCRHFIKGGAFTTWTLLWADYVTGTEANTLYPVVQAISVTGTRKVYVDDLRVPDADLSAVLQPTCLSTFDAANGTSLDAITPEVGGGWTEQVGDFDIQSNKAHFNTASSNGIATVDAGMSDCMVDATLARTANGFLRSLILRWSDANNHWKLRDSNATGYDLVEVNGGVETDRASGASPGAGTHDMRAICYGQTIDGFIDGGTKIRYASAALNETETEFGIELRHTDTDADNFAIYPRTAAVFDATFGAV